MIMIHTGEKSTSVHSATNHLRWLEGLEPHDDLHWKEIAQLYTMQQVI